VSGHRPRHQTGPRFERVGQPGDIAAAVAFLAVPDTSWINGQKLRVSGGIISSRPCRSRCTAASLALDPAVAVAVETSRSRDAALRKSSA